MVGQFLTLVLEGDTVTATGTFSPENDAINHATVLFMVVQGDNNSMVWTRGSGEWKRGDPVNGDTWVGHASADGDAVNGASGRLDPAKGSGVVRGIAVAMVVLPAQPGQVAGTFEPPTIQALTWCVTTRLDAATAPGVAP